MEAVEVAATMVQMTEEMMGAVAAEVTEVTAEEMAVAVVVAAAAAAVADVEEAIDFSFTLLFAKLLFL